MRMNRVCRKFLSLFNLLQKFINKPFFFLLFNTAAFSCHPNFFPFHGGCFSVNTTNLVTWQQALAQCRVMGGTLAKIDREGLRYAFSNMLKNMRPRPNNLHIGLKALYKWAWIDGSFLNHSWWMPDYHVDFQGTVKCAVLYAGSTRLKNVTCHSRYHPLCQKKPGI